MQLAPLYPFLYQILQPAFPGCLWAGNPTSQTIALTFDDGPHSEYTPQLLEVLDKYSILASFFLLGVCVERLPKLARSICERGHWIGIHGYEHHSFPLLTQARLKQSLQATQAAIASACQMPVTAIRDVRPPNGLFTPQTLTLLHQWRYRPVMWSVVPEDWVRPGVAVVVERVLQQVRNGSLIVLHDGSQGGQDVASIIRQLIPCLLQQGYQFATVDDLWQQAKL